MFALRSDSAEATERLGASLAPLLEPGDVVSLTGPLGAGKTRFVAGLARGLDAKARVRSPTFTLVNEYRGRLLLIHLDLYRLDHVDPLELGLDEQRERGALVVEWGERLPNWFREDALEIAIAPVLGVEDSRTLEVRAERGRGRALLSAWRAGAPEEAR